MIGFWNVTRAKGKDEQFCEKIMKWDVIGLVETWIEGAEWERWKRRVPREFNWTIQGARRGGKKGRAKGGTWVGIRKGLEGGYKDWEEEGIIISMIAIGVRGQVWRIKKRTFGGDWERRMKMFEWLVGSVIGF